MVVFGAALLYAITTGPRGIAGLVSVASGTIHVGGQAVSDLPPHARARRDLAHPS